MDMRRNLWKKFWSNVLVGDAQIDTEQVDSRRHISGYDEITQAQIRKTIFDQTQYHKGLPSSDEILRNVGGSTSSSKAQRRAPDPGTRKVRGAGARGGWAGSR